MAHCNGLSCCWNSFPLSLSRSPLRISMKWKLSHWVTYADTGANLLFQHQQTGRKYPVGASRAALSLAWSKAAPLSITFYVGEIMNWLGFSDLVVLHFWRAQSLVLCERMITHDLFQTFPDFPQSMPSLKKLGQNFQKVQTSGRAPGK